MGFDRLYVVAEFRGDVVLVESLSKRFKNRALPRREQGKARQPLLALPAIAREDPIEGGEQFMRSLVLLHVGGCSCGAGRGLVAAAIQHRQDHDREIGTGLPDVGDDVEPLAAL